ncbi:hypothetical protein ACF06L_30420 [Streptomyces sp. NPDC015408]
MNHGKCSEAKAPKSLAEHLALAAVRGWFAGIGRSMTDLVLKVMLDR